MIEEFKKTSPRSILFKIWLAIFVIIVVAMTIVGFVSGVPQKLPYGLMVLIVGLAGATILLGLWMLIRWFIRWLFCWRNLRRALIGLAGLATVIAIIYTVENWRGKRSWETYKHEAESKGAVLDWNAFIPPPMPDEQNIFKAPKMQEWFVGRGGNELSKRLSNTSLPEFVKHRGANIGALPVVEIVVVQSKPADADATLQFDDPAAPEQIEQLVQNVIGARTKGSQDILLLARPAGKIKPARIFVQSDKIPTSEEMVKFVPGSALASFETTARKRSGITLTGTGYLRIESASSNSFRLLLSPSGYTAADYLAWSDQFESDFNLLREALKRPYSRMDGDYQQAFEMPIPNFFCVRSVAQTLAQRAQCFLLLGEPEKALRELTLIHELSRLLEAKPTGQPMTLVAAMINVAVTGLYTDTIADGMRLHIWREPQLAALQEQLQKVNLLAFVEGAFVFERVATCHMLETIEPRKLGSLMDSSPIGGDNLWHEIKSGRFLFMLVPRGWFYQNMVSHAKLMAKSIDGFDLSQQLIFPRKLDEASRALNAVVSDKSPYKYIVSISVPNSSRAAQKLAVIQTKANEATIACALERYRLAHGSFPETLDALAPQFIKNIPRDIIGGQPLKYRRTDGGKFILYSVGWNETDDGGTFVEGEITGVDSGEGDWVWQNPAK